ncbi:DUF4345 family protein [Oleomonas cavernae]|nr:DUF4345 family protein [Oleomonas cavernae]
MDGFLIITGIIIVLVGLRPIFSPVAASLPFGIELNSVNARNQTRASAGGVAVAAGILVTAAAAVPVLILPALVLVAVLTAGLTLGRLISFVTDGRPTTLIWVSFGAELLGLAQSIFWITVVLPASAAA